MIRNQSLYLAYKFWNKITKLYIEYIFLTILYTFLIFDYKLIMRK